MQTINDKFNRTPITITREGLAHYTPSVGTKLVKLSWDSDFWLEFNSDKKWVYKYLDSSKNRNIQPGTSVLQHIEWDILTPKEQTLTWEDVVDKFYENVDNQPAKDMLLEQLKALKIPERVLKSFNKKSGEIKFQKGPTAQNPYGLNISADLFRNSNHIEFKCSYLDKEFIYKEPVKEIKGMWYFPTLKEFGEWDELPMFTSFWSADNEYVTQQDEGNPQSFKASENDRHELVLVASNSNKEFKMPKLFKSIEGLHTYAQAKEILGVMNGTKTVEETQWELPSPELLVEISAKSFAEKRKKKKKRKKSSEGFRDSYYNTKNDSVMVDLDNGKLLISDYKSLEDSGKGQTTLTRVVNGVREFKHLNNCVYQKTAVELCKQVNEDLKANTKPTPPIEPKEPAMKPLLTEYDTSRPNTKDMLDVINKWSKEYDFKPHERVVIFAYFLTSLDFKERVINFNSLFAYTTRIEELTSELVKTVVANSLNLRKEAFVNLENLVSSVDTVEELEFAMRVLLYGASVEHQVLARHWTTPEWLNMFNKDRSFPKELTSINIRLEDLNVLTKAPYFTKYFPKGNKRKRIVVKYKETKDIRQELLIGLTEAVDSGESAYPQGHIDFVKEDL